MYENVQFRLEKCIRREKRSANKKKAQRVAVNIYHLQNESFRTDLRIWFFLHFQCICVPRFRVICTSRKPIMNIHKKILDTLQNHKPNVWQWIYSMPKHTVLSFWMIFCTAIYILTMNRRVFISLCHFDNKCISFIEEDSSEKAEENFS